MDILKVLYTLWDKEAGAYKGYHFETETDMITDFAAGVKKVMSDDQISRYQYYYERAALPVSAKTKITIGSMALAINGKKYTLNNSVDLSLGASFAWDSSSSSYITAANRKGKDFYIYANRRMGPQFLKLFFPLILLFQRDLQRPAREKSEGSTVNAPMLAQFPGILYQVMQQGTSYQHLCGTLSTAPRAIQKEWFMMMYQKSGWISMATAGMGRNS